MGCVIAFASPSALNQHGGDAHKREFVYGIVSDSSECKVIGSSD